MNKKIEKQDIMLYDKPTEFTMKANMANTVYCPNCKHSVEFWSNSNKELCTWCGRLVFKTKKDEFNFRMKQKLRKARNEKE